MYYIGLPREAEAPILSSSRQLNDTFMALWIKKNKDNSQKKHWVMFRDFRQYQEWFKLKFTCNIQSNLILRTLLNSDDLSTTTTILESQFESLKHDATSEQRPPVNNGHIFGVPRVVFVYKFDCIPIPT